MYKIDRRGGGLGVQKSFSRTDPTYFHILKYSGLQHRVTKIKGLKDLSLWRKFISFIRMNNSIFRHGRTKASSTLLSFGSSINMKVFD